MWSKKTELAYWTAHDKSFHDANILKKYQFFDVDSYYSGQEFEDVVDLAVDIGGGMFGGALQFFFKAKRYILVDALAKEFRILGRLNGSIDSVTANFDDTPLIDNIADVVFAWNVYDHADDMEHFTEGVFEAMRILKPGGLFFGAFPMRKQPNDNHPVCITPNDIYEVFSLFPTTIVKEERIGKPHYNDETMFITIRKN